MNDMFMYRLGRKRGCNSGGGGGGSSGGDGFAYRVRFYVDGSLYDTQWVEHGKSATAPAEPTKENDGRYSYIFSGWDSDYSNVTAPKDINAVFTATELDLDDVTYRYAKIIDRTISGAYTNATATSVGTYALIGCTALTAVHFPLATSIGGFAFNGCSALTMADFPVATTISGSNVFTGSNLTVLILRSATVCKLDYADCLRNTPIASGTGYIYVPRNLVDTYKAASVWSTYANQFRAIEDYPDICGGES